jgi:hypothetical protein
VTSNSRYLASTPKVRWRARAGALALSLIPLLTKLSFIIIKVLILVPY